MACPGLGFKDFTSGDKDLWHLGWMIHGQKFNYCPYVGAVGYFSRDKGRDKNKWYMTSQAKFGHTGDVVVMHQLWREHPKHPTPCCLCRAPPPPHPAPSTPQPHVADPASPGLRG